MSVYASKREVCELPKNIHLCIKTRGLRASKNVWYVLLVVLLVTKNRLLVRLVEDITYAPWSSVQRLKAAPLPNITNSLSRYLALTVEILEVTAGADW
jgi:hypothetical protein